MRKVWMALAVAAAATVMVAPAASAGTNYPAGVFPSMDAARASCDAGIAQGRWKACSYQPLQGGQAQLWVFI